MPPFPPPASGWPGGDSGGFAPSYAPAAQPAAPMLIPYRGGNRGAVKMLGNFCLVAAWLSLVIGVVGAISSFASGAAMGGMVALMGGLGGAQGAGGLGGPGGGGLGGALPGGGADGGLMGSGADGGLGGGLGGLPGGGADALGPLTGALQAAIPVLTVGGAILSLVHGVLFFAFFNGLAQVCKSLLAAEDRLQQQDTLLQALLARSGR